MTNTKFSEDLQSSEIAENIIGIHPQALNRIFKQIINHKTPKTELKNAQKTTESQFVFPYRAPIEPYLAPLAPASHWLCAEEPMLGSC